MRTQNIALFTSLLLNHKKYENDHQITETETNQKLIFTCFLGLLLKKTKEPRINAVIVLIKPVIAKKKTIFITYKPLQSYVYSVAQYKFLSYLF